jgi:TRAP-type C4-dicarboxylate transport system permease small subunit
MPKLDKTIAGSLIAFVATTIAWMTYFYVERLANPFVSYEGVLGYIMAIDQVVSVVSATVATIAILVKRFCRKSTW